MNEKLQQIKENFNILIQDEEEIKISKDYKEIRDKYVEEYNTNNFRKLKLEEYSNVKAISTNYFGYKIEFGEYVRIQNPKLNGPVYKLIIYRNQDNKKYAIANSNLSDDEAKEIWKKLRNYIADFLDSVKDVNNYDEIKYFETFNREKIKEILKTDYFKNDKNFNTLFSQVPGVLLYMATQLYPDKFIGIKSISILNQLIQTLGIEYDKNIKLNCIHKSFLINKYIRDNIPEINNKEYDPIILFNAINRTYHFFGYKEDKRDDELKLEPEVMEEPKEYNFMSENEFNRIVKLLEYKKNIILEGVPGVGKTYIARKIASKITNNIEENIKIIQFHQSYAYEDFIQGLRPQNDGTFKPIDGILKVICDNARKDIQNCYVIIIDEINRGNISKIFGETFMLIEKDKRITTEQVRANINSKYAVTLPYSENKEEKFDIPENVYFIGTMNTMDKSIASMDFALRRRFAMYEVEPCFEDQEGESNFKNYLNDINNTNLNILVEKIKSINNSKKLDGIKFGHSYFCGLNNCENLDTRLDFIINYEIYPQLKEYLIGDNSKIEKIKSFLSISNDVTSIDNFLNNNKNEEYNNE